MDIEKVMEKDSKTNCVRGEIRPKVVDVARERDKPGVLKNALQPFRDSDLKNNGDTSSHINKENFADHRTATGQEWGPHGNNIPSIITITGMNLIKILAHPRLNIRREEGNGILKITFSFYPLGDLVKVHMCGFNSSQGKYLFREDTGKVALHYDWNTECKLELHVARPRFGEQ